MIRATGFSLVEALVALLVVSFGLLGVATMQLRALEGAHVAYRHSLVSLMAIDAQERVWASLAGNAGLTGNLRSCLGNNDLEAVNDAWVGYWFNTADLGFSNHASEITFDPVEVALAPNEIAIDLQCRYQVRVSWEELPYSINEIDKGNVDGENGQGNGQGAVEQERIKEFQYFFGVPIL